MSNNDSSYKIPKWSEFLSDKQFQLIEWTLGFNIFAASCYLFMFLIMRACCGASARDNAKKLPRRTPSYFQRHDQELEK